MEKKKKKEWSLSNLWVYPVRSNIHVIRVPKGEEKGWKALEEIWLEISKIQQKTKIYRSEKLNGTKQDKHRENHTKTYHSQTSKN